MNSRQVFGEKKTAACNNGKIFCNWYNFVSCTELIKDAESIKGKCTPDKAAEDVFLICQLEVKDF